MGDRFHGKGWILDKALTNAQKIRGLSEQGCISCGILLSGTGARGVSSEHMENVEMFSENCALVWLSENRDLVLGEPCSGPQRTVLWLSENRALVLGETCSGSQRNVLWFSENRALALREPCSGSRRKVLWF